MLRRLSLVALPAAAVLAIFYVAYRLVDPLPPRRLVMGAGIAGSGYDNFARRYARILARDCIDLEIRNTAGAVENLSPRREGQHSWNVSLDSSFLGGGTLGCNWQPLGTAFVLGIEGEGGYLKLQGSAFDPLISAVLPVAAVRGTPDVLGSAKIGNGYGMITGRLGYAWGPALIYVKGGAAFVSVQASILDQCNTVPAGCGNWLIATSGSQTRTTGTVGGGLEWALPYQWRNWSIKAEYMFIGLGHDTLTTCGTAISPAGTPVGGGQFCFNHDFSGIHTAKIGLNYRFGPLARAY